MMRWMRSFPPAALGLAVLVAFGAWSLPALADDYVIGPEDVLQVSVWMHPELEKTVTVNGDGVITYAPLGDIKASGLTASQLGARVGDKLSTYLRQTTTVTITVTQFLSHSIYVSGAVAKPGRYGFEKIPGVIDVLTQAGGAVPGADLSQVQIVRKEGEARRTLMADVAASLRDGDTSKLPALKPGDTVMVPAGSTGGAIASGEGAGVLGEVQKPGLYAVGGGQDLWMVLAVAGGLTARGDISRVRVITAQASGPPAVYTYNLRDALRNGPRGPFMVKPGDVVFVEASAASGWGKAWNGFAQVLSVSRDLLNLAVLNDYLKRGFR